jgi:hypothetical protein
MAAMIEILISKHKGEAVWFFLIEIADLRIADCLDIPVSQPLVIGQYYNLLQYM